MISLRRLPTLDGLISILLVLAAHMVPVGPRVLGLNYSVGAMGMSLFFALCGFLITSTLIHNPDILEFLVKRLARIVPLAYAYTFGRGYIDVLLGKIMDPGRQELDSRKTRSPCKTGGLILCSCSRATGNPWPLTN